MLVEIPDPEIILGFVVAFFIGLFALYVFNKIKPSRKHQERTDPSSYDRLEFYERQLIDMKIRLDSLEIGEDGPKFVDVQNFARSPERVPGYEERQNPKTKLSSLKPHEEPKNDYHSTVDYVLGLITDKSMTSRDIQNASHRSREHTSRLMKKLYQEGYVERNTKTKPFTYSITDKGRAKIGILDYMKEVVA